MLDDTHGVGNSNALHTSYTAHTRKYAYGKVFSAHKCYVWILQRLAVNDTASVVHYFHRLKPSNWLILVNPSFFIFQWSNLLYQAMVSVRSNTDAHSQTLHLASQSFFIQSWGFSVSSHLTHINFWLRVYAKRLT